MTNTPVSPENDALQLYHEMREQIKAESEQIIKIGEKFGEDEAELETEMEVIRASLHETKAFGLVLQRALWNLVKWKVEGGPSFSLRFQVQTLKELIEQRFGGDDYAMRQVHTITRIFLPMYQAAYGLPLISETGQPVALDESGKPRIVPPLTHPETGEALTPEYFLNSTGNIQKLKIVSSHFLAAIQKGDYEGAQEWVDRVVEQTTGEIKTEIRSLNSGSKSRWRLKKKYVTRNGKQLIQPEFEPMTDDEYLVFISQMRDFIEEG